jgi:hypothetical protein
MKSIFAGCMQNKFSNFHIINAVFLLLGGTFIYFMSDVLSI